jgi:hypothetical protein
MISRLRGSESARPELVEGDRPVQVVLLELLHVVVGADE